MTDLTDEQRAALAPLTPKRRAFVLAYVGKAAGNATEAARIAGYKKPNTLGPRLVKVRAVADAIAAFSEARDERFIATMADLRALWTAIAFGAEASAEEDEDGFVEMQAAAVKDRLKASELLAKSMGGFLERREVTTVEPPKSEQEALERLDKLKTKLRRVS